MSDGICLQEDEYLCYAWKVPDAELYVGRYNFVELLYLFTRYYLR